MDDYYYPAWPERWEFFDGILKYDPDAPSDIGGELDVGGVPMVNPTWIVASSEHEDQAPQIT